MMFKVGKLREVATIERDEADDGDQQPDYQTWKQGVPCSIATVSGDETYRGRQLEAHLTHVVELHRIPGLEANMRLRVTGGHFAGRYLNIAYVRDLIEDATPVRTQLYCRELET